MLHGILQTSGSPLLLQSRALLAGPEVGHTHLHAEPALVWDRDGYALHLVLDVSSTRPDLRHRGARCSPNPALPHSLRAWQVSCALALLTLLTITNYPACVCVHLLLALCKAAPPCWNSHSYLLVPVRLQWARRDSLSLPTRV